MIYINILVKNLTLVHCQIMIKTRQQQDIYKKNSKRLMNSPGEVDKMSIQNLKECMHGKSVLSEVM